MIHGKDDGWRAGCRGMCCVLAHRRATRNQRILRAARGAVGPDTLVDAADAHDRLLQMMALGHSARTLAQATGVADVTIRATLRRESRQITARIDQKIKSTPILPPWRSPGVTLPDHRLIPAAGTVRRLQALSWMGYTSYDISAASGIPRDTIVTLIPGNSSLVRARTYRQVAKFFRVALRTSLPSGPQADRCRAHARKRGYSPPGVWEDIDDPRVEGFP